MHHFGYGFCFLILIVVEITYSCAKYGYFFLYHHSLVVPCTQGNLSVVVTLCTGLVPNDRQFCDRDQKLLLSPILNLQYYFHAFEPLVIILLMPGSFSITIFPCYFICPFKMGFKFLCIILITGMCDVW